MKSMACQGPAMAVSVTYLNLIISPLPYFNTFNPIARNLDPYRFLALDFPPISIVFIWNLDFEEATTAF